MKTSNPPSRTEDRSAFDQTYQSLGYRFRVLADPPEMATSLHRLLSQFSIEDRDEEAALYRLTQSDTQNHLSLPGGSRQTTKTPIELHDYVLWSIYMESIRSCGDYLALHAAAASWKGIGLVLPAPQDSGKSTLATGLTRAGFDYLTDEAALVDVSTGLIHPYPKGVCLGSRSLEAIPGLRERLPEEITVTPRPQYHIAPDEIRPGSIGRPVPLRLVVFPRFERGGVNQLTRITKAEGMYTMLEDSWNFSVLPTETFGKVVGLISSIDFYRLSFGNLKRAVDDVKRLAESVSSGVDA